MFEITVRVKEYDSKQKKWVENEFSGEFSGPSEKEALQEAKEFYAYEMDTDENEIEILSVKKI